MQKSVDSLNNRPTSKYLIIVRHGERIDETTDCFGKLSADDLRDSDLTKRGKHRSALVGKKVAALLDSYGLMGKDCLKVRYMSSVIYRCIQTMACLRNGIGEYVMENKEKFEDFERVKKCFLARKTHIEEACSEKKPSVTPEYVANLRISTHNKQILEEFKHINPVHKSLYDYQSKHAHLSLNQVFLKKKEANKYLHMFFEDVFERLLKDDSHSAYVVVAHSKYIKQLNAYLQLPKLTSDVDYNAASVLEFRIDGSKTVLLHNVQLHGEK